MGNVMSNTEGTYRHTTYVDGYVETFEDDVSASTTTQVGARPVGKETLVNYRIAMVEMKIAALEKKFASVHAPGHVRTAPGAVR